MPGDGLEVRLEVWALFVGTPGYPAQPRSPLGSNPRPLPPEGSCLRRPAPISTDLRGSIPVCAGPMRVCDGSMCYPISLSPHLSLVTPLTFIAFLTDPDPITRILVHIGEPTSPPGIV